MKDKNIEEPRLERVVNWLIIDNGDEEIKKDIQKLASVLYFFAEEQTASFNEVIVKLTEEEQRILLNNLMNLYPLSRNIVLTIFNQNNNIKVNEIIDLFDKGDAITKAFNRLINSISQEGKKTPSILQNYLDKIDNYEKEKLELKEEIEKLKKAGSDEKELFAEVTELKRELNELKKSYTKEALEQQKIALEKGINDRHKIKEAYEKDKNVIKEIETNLKNIRSENNAYKKSLKTLSDLVKNLPDSEDK